MRKELKVNLDGGHFGESGGLGTQGTQGMCQRVPQRKLIVDLIDCIGRINIAGFDLSKGTDCLVFYLRLD